jgi:hypothetical protein
VVDVGPVLAVANGDLATIGMVAEFFQGLRGGAAATASAAGELLGNEGDGAVQAD